MSQSTTLSTIQQGLPLSAFLCCVGEKKFVGDWSLLMKKLQKELQKEYCIRFSSVYLSVDTLTFLKWWLGEEEVVHEPGLMRSWSWVHQPRRPGASGSMLIIDSRSEMWIYICQCLSRIYKAKRSSAMGIFACHWYIPSTNAWSRPRPSTFKTR